MCPRGWVNHCFHWNYLQPLPLAEPRNPPLTWPPFLSRCSQTPGAQENRGGSAGGANPEPRPGPTKSCAARTPQKASKRFTRDRATCQEYWTGRLQTGAEDRTRSGGTHQARTPWWAVREETRDAAGDRGGRRSALRPDARIHCPPPPPPLREQLTQSLATWGGGTPQTGRIPTSSQSFYLTGFKYTFIQRERAPLGRGPTKTGVPGGAPSCRVLLTPGGRAGLRTD